jgi:3-oxoacyl-[acyl-carrier protein] reductase
MQFNNKLPKEGKSIMKPNLTLSLDGLAAFVTGGGNGAMGGMGAAICRCLGRAGASVAVNDLTEEAAMATVNQLREMGIQSEAVVGDVSDPVQAAAMIDRVEELFGSIDILVNNAFNPGQPKYLVDLTDEDWENSIAVNLNGPFYLCRAALPKMRARGFGRIINMSSVAAIRVSMNGSAHYTAIKEGILGLTRHLTAEAARHGITANAIMPAFTLNPRTVTNSSPERLATFASSVPTQRGADPEEIGMLAAFLASPAAGQISGTAIPVDGGTSAIPGNGAKRKALWAARQAAAAKETN